jgi:hypothetical protein
MTGTAVGRERGWAERQSLTPLAPLQPNRKTPKSVMRIVYQAWPHPRRRP